ncbi:hypothetical protein [Sphingobacterium anhuiense]|uniref:IPT/TIG domain-containing protein n=1 Tax=Sphingobacterium anhuiense TaxID=493780 RepID=A0ABW5YQE4_9SPHI
MTLSQLIARYPLIYKLMVILFLFTSCSKEKGETATPTTPPVAITGAFEAISKNSIIFNASLENQNSLDQITEYGFIVYAINAQQVKSAEQEIPIGQKLNEQKIRYTYKPTAAFEMNQTYYYCFYVKTKNTFIKGKFNAFELNKLQLGSPSEFMGMAGENIQLQGDFSMLDSNYFLRTYLDQTVRISYSISADKKALSFKIPHLPNLQHGKKLEIKLEKRYSDGNNYSQLVANIRILGKIEPPAQKTYNFRDKMRFFGTALPNSWESDKTLQLIIGNITVPYQSEIDISTLKELKGSTFKIGYKNGRDSLVFSDMYQVIGPDANKLSFEVTAIHPNTLFIVNGFYFYTYFEPDKSSANLGGHPIDLISYDYNPMSFTTRNIPEGEYTLQIKNNLYQVDSKQKLVVKKFDWQSIDKKTAYVGEYVTLSGNFIKGFSYMIYATEYQYAEIICQEDGKLRFKAQSFMGEGSTLKIAYYVYSKDKGAELYFHNKEIPFKSNEITFDSFSPGSGAPGTVVQLKGRGIGLAVDYMIGNMRLYPQVKSDDEVTIIIPIFNAKGKVKLSIVSANNKIIQPEGYFEIL